MSMGTNLVTAFGLVTVSIYCFLSIWRTIVKHQKLSAIPTIGHSGILTSYIGAFRFYKHCREMTQEGYDKYCGSLFKVPMLTQWMIVVTGPRLTEDVRLAPDDQLSSKDAFAETFHTDILFERQFHEDSHHIEVIRTLLTRNIAARFSDIQDEIVAAFAESIPKDNQWTTRVARKITASVVCRVANRVFVGLPLCRDADYRSLIEQFVLDMIISANILNLFPVSLRRFVVHFLRKVPEDINRGMKLLEPVVRERLEQAESSGEKDWPGKPNDAISWFMESGNRLHGRTLKTLTTNILIMNFASIHTTTQTFTNVLFYLANHPEYVVPMREEIESVIGEEGWTKSAIDKLSKMDSFVRESLRLSSNGAFTVRRKARKDFTFSNGVTVPAGCVIGIPHRSIHCDPVNYSDPEVFDGFRFSKMRETESDCTKYGTTTLTPDHLPFGQGRNACPGRFFGITLVKAMLTHLLLNYDVKMANDGGLPSEWWFGILSVPNRTAEVMFRKRV